MDDGDFKNSKYGKLVWNQDGMYYNFEPNKLPFNFDTDKEYNNLLVETATNLGRLDGLSERIPKKEIELILYPFLIREAKLSSEIEGTRSTLSDVYKSDKEKEEDREKALDNEEIKNYLKALNFGLEKLEKENFTEEIIKELHRILLRGVRGQSKNPGEYKEYQNAIGKDGDNWDTAKFVPASPRRTKELMENLISSLNKEDENPLDIISLTHYQFETIHPFQDGNGRVGRLLIILYLFKKRILKLPMMYVSEYFNAHRRNYINLLYGVSSENKILEWIKFFLQGLNEQSKKSLEFALKLDSYKKQIKDEIKNNYRSMKLLSIVDMLFVNPYIKINDVVQELKITHAAATKLIITLVNIKVLEELDNRKRDRIFLARKILRILEI
jgi:Fic family protein